MLNIFKPNDLWSVLFHINTEQFQAKSSGFQAGAKSTNWDFLLALSLSEVFSFATAWETLDVTVSGEIKKDIFSVIRNWLKY